MFNRVVVRWMVRLTSPCAIALFLAVASPASADRIVLRDGTVLDGTAIKQGDGYWFKSTNGESRHVSESDILKMESGARDSGPAGSPAPGAHGKAALTLSQARTRSNTVDAPLAAVAIWQEFIDSNKDPNDLKVAKAELARWKGLADSGAERIGGKWVAGEQRKAILLKAAGLYKESEELLANHQTLEAVKKLEEAARIYPNSFEANFTLGYIAMLGHNPEKALPWFEQALRVKPNNPETMANLGIAYAVKKRPEYEKSIQTLYKAAKGGESQDIVQDLYLALNEAPEGLRRAPRMKSILEDTNLLASRYGVNPTGTWRLIPPHRPRTPGKHDPSSQPPAGTVSGTGFVINDEGLILTNRHVVEGGKNFLIVADGKQKSGEIVVVSDDPEQDLALIKMKLEPGAKAPFVQLSPADHPTDGADCVVIGYPLIDRLGANVKITRGIVSSGAGSDPDCDVTLDCKVNPGNSGGPIFDKYGNVMAIIARKSLASATEDSYGLGLSAGRVRRFLAKNHVTVANGEKGPAPLSAEDIATKAKPATVCILSTR